MKLQSIKQKILSLLLIFINLPDHKKVCIEKNLNFFDYRIKKNQELTLKNLPDYSKLFQNGFSYINCFV